MTPLFEANVECPYCGAVTVSTFETPESDCSMIEDCQVCCRPIQILISTGEDGHVSVDVGRA